MELVSRMMDGSIPSLETTQLPEGATPPAGPIGQDEKIERLEKVSLLAGCSKKTLREVARIAELMEVPAGKELTRAGERGQEFFLIVDGTVRVEVASGKRAQLGPGAYFGEMSLLDGGPRSATVIADTPLRVLVIERRNFTRLLAELPDLTQSLLVTLCRRLREAEQSSPS